MGTGGDVITDHESSARVRFHGLFRSSPTKNHVRISSPSSSVLNES